VVAHDRLVNHEREGVNVLFADGRVEWMSRDLSPGFLAELEAGFNPPRPVNQRPATQPATP
jgi:prepilin-type processing-associated H-X9-DG protein